MPKEWFIVLSYAALCLCFGFASPTAARGDSLYFIVCPNPGATGCGSPNDFIFALDDPSLIQTAKAIVAGKIKDRVHVWGTIVKHQMPYNQAWNFYLDPRSIKFITFAPTICGRYMTTSMVENNLAKVGTPGFLPSGSWCPVGLQVSKTVPRF